ncbi:hypothetical protein FIBSPDRAFT_865774 [Athelia psychrophila]|uniref:Uncharacterized protein n=1 Tax=Athelia psychrophila TaxID=1759441 RepID=A0A166FBM8_9AGAM|nr:hypothetical protein FIBSPDRAFT_865774 [Fibularhizoctonia sp. CBS 109695]
MKPNIQDGLNGLIAAAGASRRKACLAAVLIITLDLSFFIWDENPSHECFSQALSIYKEATTNHQAVVEAVMALPRLKKTASDEEKEAFRARMTETVLAHRLSESYRVETGRG